ncbi:hypothetical protein HCC61_22965 [Streptomyces sp. HNM0575]|uniref:hypothetical protein n=1 Tax=Streptomyces sp. HNM0575 TaxID=2716338 RepID=UPI00145C75C0|nr:hypothetical protein [Streptomyces sp. HNM0575]NLU75491.1 hypothetical protein [Streptomyces sp. HNM0575]
MSATVVLRHAGSPSGEGSSAAEKKPGRKRRRGRKAGPGEDGRARYELTGAAVDAAGSPVYLDRELPPGGAEEYVSARKRSVRTFAMWTDPYRRHLWARVVTASAAEGRPVRYDVCAAAGEIVGSVTRERSFSGGSVRARWTVQQAEGPGAVGYKGRWFWWCVWWLISPLQAVGAVLCVVGGDGDLFRMPRRVRYFAGGRRVLDYGSGFEARHLTAETEGWDPRMLAALTALHSSHDGIMGDSWDTGGYEPPAPAAGSAEAAEASAPGS